MGGRSAWPDLAGGAAKPGGRRLGVARPRRGLLGRALAAAARPVLAGALLRATADGDAGGLTRPRRAAACETEA